MTPLPVQAGYVELFSPIRHRYIRIPMMPSSNSDIFDPRRKEITGTYRFGERRSPTGSGVFSLEKMDFFNNTAFNNPASSRSAITSCVSNNPERLVDQYQPRWKSPFHKQSSILRLSLENAVPDKARFSAS